jgi:hypothetical protein|tara:strand:+ start:740 stop:1600 length:861 start_codon:yes stop_codon:yes gene_type:complete
MIVWLASYPKSGNTWVRSFLISILFNKKKNFDLKDLNLINQYPSRRFFKNFINNPLDIHEVKKNWLITQDKINSDKKIKFFKTHNSLCNLDNYYFTNFKNSLGAIYIVRDPRNVITSIKNHYSYASYEEAKKFIFDENCLLGIDDKKQVNISLKENKIITPISSWKTHYNSWKMFKRNFLLIKYENLIEDPFSEFKKLCNYVGKLLNLSFDDNQIKKSIDDCSFHSLKSKEERDGFEESTHNKLKGKKNRFFFLGPKNRWKELLDDKTIYQIEKNFKKEMLELGYL